MPTFERLPFDHPWYVLFSSGTTGKPKCIVHRAGGVLLKHLEEHQLQCDVGPDDRFLYFTTPGWMMWNWLASVLASQATVVLFDGSPFHPGTDALWDLADAEGVTIFGTSAKYIDSIAKVERRPMSTHRLDTVRTIVSTGSPLSPESFVYVYDAVKADVHLASISGGTDLCGCFVGSDPTGPVWAGEIQRPALGMAVGVAADDGHLLGPGEKGELVCTAPFPSLPLGFWGDDDGSRYRAAYFDKHPGMWSHGDFASWTEHGGIVIHGRSDATLNPGGVRIGTAELYRQVEQMPEVLEALAFGRVTSATMSKSFCSSASTMASPSTPICRRRFARVSAPVARHVTCPPLLSRLTICRGPVAASSPNSRSRMPSTAGPCAAQKAWPTAPCCGLRSTV